MVFLRLLLILSVSTFCVKVSHSSQCFAQLRGAVGDVNADIDLVNAINMDVLPRLKSILEMEYFHYIEVNLQRSCPFFKDDLRCGLKDCHVNDCPVEEVPFGIRNDPGYQIKSAVNKYSEAMNMGNLHPNDEIDCHLSKLDSSLSAESQSVLRNWTRYDEMNETLFCEPDDDRTGNMIFVDLLKNPERYTGYKGEASNRIWYMIYAENCFNDEGQGYAALSPNSDLWQCLEKRAFYRLISGLHTSITIHLAYRYPSNLIMCTKSCWSSTSLTDTDWAPNVREFTRRFHPDYVSDGPNRLRNLYFTYLVELRALAKAAPYLRRQAFYTGNETSDRNTRQAVHNLLNIIQSKGNLFDERQLFADNSHETKMLKQRFRDHFRNISLIMDCVGCQKCRLWGKIQTQGMGTALKILFSSPEHTIFGPKNDPASYPGFQLQRREIVALFNAFGRLSTSIGALREFCNLI